MLDAATITPPPPPPMAMVKRHYSIAAPEYQTAIATLSAKKVSSATSPFPSSKEEDDIRTPRSECPHFSRVVSPPTPHEGGSSSFSSLSTPEQYDRLVEHLYDTALKLSSSHDDKKYWVAVAGGPGSGKTTTAEAVVQKLNAQWKNHHPDCHNDIAVVIPMDGFHLSRDDLMEKFGGPEALKRRGAPWTFDTDSIREKLFALKREGSGVLPTYNRERSNPSLDGVHIKPYHKILVVEGLYLFHIQDPDWAPLNVLWNERWWVQAPTREVQKERLLQRSLKHWSPIKTQQWGEGREGAKRLMEYNDVKNMDLLAYCSHLADAVVVTK